MASPRLDALVKGAPTSPSTVSAAAALTSESNIPLITQTPIGSQIDPSDPTSLLPTSTPHIYLNLLILEASLRSQYLIIRARRRQYTFFVSCLFLWNLYFGYNLFLRTREDGLGVGGSVYWMVESGQKLALMAGVLTGLLLWGTGQWERGVRWPRRWMGITNRGLRTFNIKIVVIQRGLLKDIAELLRLLLSSMRSPREGTRFRFLEAEAKLRGLKGIIDEEMLEDEEDLEPGGDYIKVLLLPKSFSSEFREAWEVYRSDYWESENERRQERKTFLQQAEEEAIRRCRGRFWWLGIGPNKPPPVPSSAHRTPTIRSRRSSTVKEKSSRASLQLPGAGDERAKRHHRRTASSRTDDGSRTSSRSTTPNSDVLGNEKSKTDTGSRRTTRSSRRSKIPDMTTPEAEEEHRKVRSRYSLRGSSSDESIGQKAGTSADESLQRSIRMAKPMSPAM